MRKFHYPGIHLEEDFWICKASEAEEARRRGIPRLIISSKDDEYIAKAILWPYLLKKFPAIASTMQKPRDVLKIQVLAEPRIDFEDGLGSYDNSTPEYMQFTENGDYRESLGGLDDQVALDYEEMKCSEFFKQTELTVDIEVLQHLKMLPKFLTDISDAIRENLMDIQWWDGWNKKLNMPTGNFSVGQEAPNLIILDVSGSIPNGVASTMVALIETLRNQANADLIVTSGSSHWYSRNEPCPTVQALSHLVGGGNESKQFYRILKEHVFGRHWGNVICFGDQDAPEHYGSGLQVAEASRTRVDHLMSFHTYAHRTPGYARWCHQVQLGSEEINTDWVLDMKHDPWCDRMRKQNGLVV